MVMANRDEHCLICSASGALRSVAQSCPTLRDPVDYSPPGSSVHGIFQARILEWVAISCFRGSSRPRDQTQVSHVSCIGRRVLYHFATWEAPVSPDHFPNSLVLKALPMKAVFTPGPPTFPDYCLCSFWLQLKPCP